MTTREDRFDTLFALWEYGLVIITGCISTTNDEIGQEGGKEVQRTLIPLFSMLQQTVITWYYMIPEASLLMQQLTQLTVFWDQSNITVIHYPWNLLDILWAGAWNEAVHKVLVYIMILHWGVMMLESIVASLIVMHWCKLKCLSVIWWTQWALCARRNVFYQVKRVTKWVKLKRDETFDPLMILLSD